MFVAVNLIRIRSIPRVVMALGSEVSENTSKNASQKVKKIPANNVNDKCGDDDSVSKGKLDIAHAHYVTYFSRSFIS